MADSIESLIEAIRRNEREKILSELAKSVGSINEGIGSLQYPNTPTPRLMTVANLMEFLQVSETQIYIMLKNGLPYVSIGHHKRFLADEVVEWMKEQAGKSK